MIITSTSFLNIIFGMSENDVLKLLGQPIRRETYQNEPSNTTYPVYVYDDFKVCFNQTGVNEGIIYGDRYRTLNINGVTYNWQTPSDFHKLCDLDNQPYEFLGFIVLYNLGLAFDGFLDEEDEKIMRVFQKGGWEDIKTSKHLKQYQRVS